MAIQRLLFLAVLAAVRCLVSRPALAQSLPIAIENPPDPLLQGLQIPATAAEEGMWSESLSWPLVSIHSTLLPDGSVLTFGSPIGQGAQDGRTFVRWDPLTGEQTSTPNSQGVNSFCSAAILQPDTGNLLVSGGNEPLQSTLFDFASGTATTLPSPMAADRWYGTMTMLADGRSLMTGGAFPYAINVWQDPNAQQSLNDVSMTPEVYTPGLGWSSLFGANSREAFGPDYNRWWYPRQWVAPDGNVFGISSEKWWRLDPTGTGSFIAMGDFKTGASNATRPNIGPTSTAVMYDLGMVLQVGGNGYVNGHDTVSSERATIFDIRGGNPVITDIESMQFGRQWPNATVLPTGAVVITGGTQRADNGGADAVYQAELFDPGSRTFRPLASAHVIRNYHSSAILLPNGTIFSSGGGVPGPVTNFNYEIFYPPYLFNQTGGATTLADRPTLLSIEGSSFAYDTGFQVELADARPISRVALVGLSTTTHSFNMGQRYYPAVFSQAGAMLSVQTPPGAASAPPGFYLLFVVDSAGVPSRGFVLSLGDVGCQSPADCDDGRACTTDVCLDGLCTHQNQCTDPLAQYSFEAGGTDDTGNGNDATLADGASIGSGPLGNAVDINGGAQYVDLPDGLLTPCNDFTFAAWVQLDDNPAWNRIFDFGIDPNTNMFLTPKVAGQDAMRFALRVPSLNGGAEQRIDAPFAFPTGVWTHIAMVLEGDQGRLYVDGAELASGPIVGDPAQMGATPNNWLGRSQYTADPALDGQIDEVTLACRAYSAAEIGSLATSAECTRDEHCNDSDTCTADACTDGVCTNASNGTCPPACTPADCDDGDPCTSDSCSGDGCGHVDNGSCTVTDPLAIYTLDDGAGSVAVDQGGLGLNATLSSGASFSQAGKLAGAVELNGAGGHVALPTGIVSGCSDFSYASWVWLDSNADWNRIFDFGTDQGTNMFLTPKVGGADLVRFAIRLPSNPSGAEEQLSFPYAFPLQTWTHVAVVLEGDLGTLYIDGAAVATATIEGDPRDMGNTPNNWLGRSQWPDPYLDGRIDEVQLSCRAYAATEIAALATPAECRTAVDCDNGDPCTTDLCNAGSCSHSDNDTCDPDAPLAVYPFDDGSGTLASDQSGNDYDGLLANGAAFTPNGKLGGAVTFDGNDGHVALPPGLVSGCSDFTYASWVWLEDNADWNRIFDFGTDWGTNMFLTPKVGGANTVRFALKTPGINGGWEEQVSFPYTFPLRTWKHIAVVLESQVATLYVDGAPVANATFQGSPRDMGDTPNNWLGRSQWPDPYFNGRLDEVQLACRAFDSAEIGALANPPACRVAADCDDNDPCTADLCNADGCSHTDNGACAPEDPVAVYSMDDGSGNLAADLSGHGRNAVLANGAAFTPEGVLSGSVVLDGAAGHVSLPAGVVSSCSDFTYASWVWLDQNADWNRIFDFGTDWGTNMFLTPKVGGADIMRFALKNPSINGGWEEQVSFAYAFPLQTWKHVAVVLEGDVATLYVDGTAVASGAIQGDPRDMGNTPNNWLGRSQWPDPYFDGRIDEVVLSCRAFSSQEISGLANVEQQAVNRRSLLETTLAAVSQFNLAQTLDALGSNGGLQQNGAQLYEQLIDSYSSAPGALPSATHCGDESNGGEPTLNGYPIQCDRLEAQQLGNLASWFAVGVANRIDLAPANGAHCGNQRLIFANNEPIGNGRMLMILEAWLPNPNPGAGRAGCRPIAEFWRSLETVGDPALRGSMLVNAFLNEGVPGVGPFLSTAHLSRGSGQIRTNNFNDDKWTMREFKIEVSGGQARIEPAPVAGSPYGPLWNDNLDLPAGAACRANFLDALDTLLDDNPAAMTFAVDEACKNAESFNDFTAENYPLHLMQGRPDGFQAQLQARLSGTGLTPLDLAARARFAGSCMGCHQESRGSSLGNGVQAPPSLGFVHISDSIVETCSDGPCFAISQGLRQVFLPYRAEFMQQVLGSSSTAN